VVTVDRLVECVPNIGDAGRARRDESGKLVKDADGKNVLV
jgi:hypothetical protein